MAKTTDKTESEQVSEEATARRPASKHYFSNTPGRGWLFGLVAVFLLFIFFALGVGVAHNRWYGPHGMQTVSYGGGPGIVTKRAIGSERGFAVGGGMYNASGQSSVQGVVTNLNGSSFTLAGNGSTTSVVTNNSTQYHGGNQVKQNDTVVVFGTNSNGTITATQLIINP